MAEAEHLCALKGKRGGRCRISVGPFVWIILHPQLFPPHCRSLSIKLLEVKFGGIVQGGRNHIPSRLPSVLRLKIHIYI